MKMNIQFIRKKFEINAKTIKELIILEERLISGKIKKEHLSKLSQIYKTFMEYCENIKEPLKMYFQEKLEYLFLNEKIFKMLLKEDNVINEQENMNILGNSFLKFSEIQNDNQSVLDKFSLNESIEPMITQSQTYQIVESIFY